MDHLIMAATKQHILQRQAYEAVWQCATYDSPAPLQICAFTSESYDAIKEKERKKTFQRDRTNANPAARDQSGWDLREID